MNTLTITNPARAGVPPAPLRTLLQRFAALWRRAADARRRRIRDRIERDTLAHLSDRDLHDIGLSRSDLPRLLRHHGVTHSSPAGAGGDPRWC